MLNSDILEKHYFETIIDGLSYAADTEKGVCFYSNTGQLESETSYLRLKELAIDFGKRLSALKFERHARVGIIAETSLDFLVASLGCQFAGVLPCPLPHVNFIGGLDAYIASLRGLSNHARLSALIGSESLKVCIEKAVEGSLAQALTFDQIRELPATGHLSPLGRDDPAYIQYSSGSTSNPKGVLITQRALTRNIGSILQYGSRSRPSDRTFSWLPFSHDMGFVGLFLTPMFGISSVDYISPAAFMRNPLLWIELMSTNRSTVTYAPSFAYQLAAQHQMRNPREYDLSCLRLAGLGGDMIRPQEMDEFTAAFASSKFKMESFLPSYGMSEAVLGISFDEHGKKPVTHRLSPKGRPFVSCGHPLPGIDMVIVDSEGQPVADGVTGHIWIRAPDMETSYFEDEAATSASRRRDGFRDTGDMGFVINERLFVSGRAKELILWRGRNIWPQDIELAAEKIAPLKPGDIAAFSVESEEGETIIVLVQCGSDNNDERSQLMKAVSGRISGELGIAAKVVLISPQSLPYTASGKLSRTLARELYRELQDSSLLFTA